MVDPAKQAIVFCACDFALPLTCAETALRSVGGDCTELTNGIRFTKRITHSIDQAKRRAHSLAVLFISLDRLRFVNDTLGHDIGARLLAEVARRVGRCLHASDCIAHLGGDELTVLMDAPSSPQAVRTTADRISRSLSTPFVIGEHDVFMATSIGISMYPKDGSNVETLLRRAGTAMRNAKRGNISYAFYESHMEASASAHLSLEADLRHALERDEILLHFQPYARTDDLRITGMEALVRWKHPKRGTVPPVEFIPLAEETGVIVPLGEWVLRAACTQARRWIDAGITDLSMSVNLSVYQLHQADFVERLASILMDTSLPPAQLTLEITESMLMEHMHDPVALLRRITSLGVKLAIDDFGTGYSSLSYLKRFPVNVLKIDRSFVIDAVEDAGAASIVSGILNLAQNLHLDVVTEGVETDAQRWLLNGLRRHWFQGYLLAKPLSPDEIESTLLEHQYPGSRLRLQQQTSR